LTAAIMGPGRQSKTVKYVVCGVPTPGFARGFAHRLPTNSPAKPRNRPKSDRAGTPLTRRKGLILLTKPKQARHGRSGPECGVRASDHKVAGSSPAGGTRRRTSRESRECAAFCLSRLQSDAELRGASFNEP